MKTITAKILVLISISVITAASDRYEAEDAIIDENSVQKVADPKASGGFYVNMKEGNLSFKVNAENSGFFTIWVSYSQPNDENGKIQNLSINGASSGQISFPKVDTLVYMKAVSKVKLIKGNNTIGINKSWGWVNIDYIELTPFQATPFSISSNLVTPDPLLNAKKMYSFIKENFQKKIISGAMTNTVMLNDGKYTPNTIENQTEMAWIKEASGKFPALLGLDFLHATGLNSDGEWYQGYTNATIALAEDMYKKGGIPVFCWHWKDPGKEVETDEAGDALDWYPGDEYVDIIGRDYYYYPREANHGSLVASFEKVKEIFNGRKIIALTENGSIPHPDSLIGDEAGWSYFMPWYGDYTMDGWAHDNTASDWNSILNHDYVITLDAMPGWDNYAVSFKPALKRPSNQNFSFHFAHGILDLKVDAEKVNIYTLNGTRIASACRLNKNSNNFQFDLNGIGKGLYLVQIATCEGDLAKTVLLK